MTNDFDVKKFIKEHVPEEYLNKDTYGLWEVKAYNYDGTTNFGIYEGYIDDIALSIKANSPNADYTELRFTPVEIKYPINRDTIPANTTCKICLPFAGSKYTISIEDKKNVYAYIFANRPVMVENNGYMIIRKPGSKADEIHYKRQQILNKLTDEEKQILGLDCNS